MRSRRFSQVDVFSAVPYGGNPLAVVHDAEDLDTEAMQRFASWTNLSETTFLLPPEDPRADYRVRIFTPTQELPFAGHPTLGSGHAWLTAGGDAQERGRDRSGVRGRSRAPAPDRDRSGLRRTTTATLRTGGRGPAPTASPGC